MPHPFGLDPDALTPGVIDAAARHLFAVGACGALAIALHDATGWPVVAITDAHNVDAEGWAGGGSALHWTVRTPDGRLLDIEGAHDPAVLLAGYHGEADDGIAAIGQSSRADVVEWYCEAQGAPIPVALAATFVAPLLQATHLRLTPAPDRASAPPSPQSRRRPR